MTILSFSLGILSIICCFAPTIKYFSLAFAIIAIILGIKERKAAIAAKKNSDLATSGIIIGIVGIPFGVVTLVISLAIKSFIGDILKALLTFLGL